MRPRFDQAARHYDEAAVIQAKVRNELLERLDVVRMEPQVVVDLGAGTGHAAIALKRRYPQKPGPRRGPRARHAARGGPARRRSCVASTAWPPMRQALPFATASIDMIFSSLMLQWCNDPDARLRECRRVLRPGGVLTFTSLGPDTLKELRALWHAADPSHAHVNAFHRHARSRGRADPGRLCRTGARRRALHADLRVRPCDLMRDLKTIGAHNANAGRPPGLTGKATLARMMAAYESFRRDGRLPATYEVVYGQAWCPTGPVRTKIPQPANEVRVPIAQLRRRRVESYAPMLEVSIFNTRSIIRDG